MDEQAIGTRLGKLHVRRLGKGPPVVLWHSLYVDGRSMLAVAEALASDRDVIVVDGPAHGRTPPVGRAFDIEECARAAEDLLDALGLPTVDWVGNAWGGHVGVALARHAPGRVRSLVAICSPLQAVEGKDRFRAYLLLGLYRLFGPGAVLGPLQGVLVLRENEAAVAHVRDVFTHQDRAGMVEAIRSLMLGRASAEGPIPVRTLFVTTEKNGLWPPDVMRPQAAAAGAEAVVLSGSKHLPPLETPDQVSKVLRDWLPA